MGLFSKILADRRSKVKDEAASTDMIDRLLQAAYAPSGKHLTDEEITGLCIAIFFGGMHNSAITTAWTLLYVCDKPDLVARLTLEQVEARKDCGGTLDFKTLNK